MYTIPILLAVGGGLPKAHFGKKERPQIGEKLQNNLFLHYFRHKGIKGLKALFLLFKCVELFKGNWRCKNAHKNAQRKENHNLT